MIKIKRSLYLQIHRDDVLSLLDRAGIPPEKLTAHRDHSFTAYYCRSWLPRFDQLPYENRLEQLDPRIAIFKRPSEQLDSGRYLRLQFAIANMEQIGIKVTVRRSQPHDKEIDAQVILSRLRAISRDMDQLAAYAWDLADGYHSHRHLTPTLEELNKQIHYLNRNLDQLVAYNQRGPLAAD